MAKRDVLPVGSKDIVVNSGCVGYKGGGGSPLFPCTLISQNYYYKTHYIMGVVAENQQGYVSIPK